MPQSKTNGGGRRRVLVVATAPVSRNDLRAELDALGVDADDAEGVQVVAPASNVSWLQWLTNEEDGARAEAERVVEETASAAGDEAAAEVGDVDPIQATEDALGRFDADELVVVVPPEDERSPVERAALEDGFTRFGLPVRYLVAGRRADG